MKKFFSIPLMMMTLALFSCSKPGDLTIARAMKSYQSQNYDEALSLFNEALSEETNYSPELIYNFIATIYLQQEDLENAVVYQEKIAGIRADYRNLVSLGMNYHLLNRDDEAEKAYQKAISLDEKKAEAYASLGALYLGQGKFIEAIENLKKAAEAEPKIAVIHANLAVAYAAAEESENSESEFKIAEDLKCENLEEFRTRAEEFLK